MRIKRLLIVSLMTLLVAPLLFAQQADPSILTLERIFSSQDFVAQPFGPAHWLDGGAGYTTVEPSATVKDASDIVRYDPESGRRTIFVSAERLIPAGQSASLLIDDYAFSSDGNRVLIYTNSQRVWRQNTRGDYWVLDRTSGKLGKLGGKAKPSTLMFAEFSPDGNRVGYVRENNLYVENVADHRIIQLTRDGSRTIINGTFDWVYEEEFDLRNGWRWSPDGKSIAYWQLNSEGVRDFYLVNYTDSLYPKLTPIPYPKAGQTNSAARVGIVSAGGGPTRWLNVPGDPRNNYLAAMDWAASSDEVMLQQFNRYQNTNKVMLGNARTGQVRTILTERDDAWVDLRSSDFHWLDGGKSFTWVSERDGWRHVYVVSRDGQKIKLITPGRFEIIAVEGVDEKNGWLYFTASPENPTEQYLYRVRLDGSGKAERVTPTSPTGFHGYQISPQAGWAFHTYSSFGVPSQAELIRLPGHALIRTLVDNAKLRANVEKLQRGPREFFRVNVGGGVELDGWIIKPPDFDPTKRYPVLFYVYGEPAGQTVLNRWGGSRYLWHQMLSQQGYIVVSVDNRGTPAPRGRAWRKVIYQQIGVLASQEQAAAAREISKWPFVDPTRIGIWGWSGGGSMSLNMIFRYPDLYKMAMAVAPVPDIHYYDTIYQERYMGLPQENEDAYRRSSPITFADQLKGKLLIVHGTGDDNVHYQGTEALVNALVAANKPFTMMAYPNRSHSISEGKNTTRHLFELLTRYVHENLPAGPAPVGAEKTKEQTMMTTVEQLTQLASDFWTWRVIHQPFSSDDIPRIERPPGWKPDWSPAAIERQRKELTVFEDRWKRIDPSAWPISQQVDYRLIGSALARVRWELDITRSWQRNPMFYVAQTLGALFEELLKQTPFDETRSAVIIERLRNIPGLVENAKQNLANRAVRPFALAALEDLKDIRPRLSKVSRELKSLLAAESAKQLDGAMEDATRALESFCQWLEQRLPEMAEQTAVGRDHYVFFLNNVALMPFTPEQLLDMGRQEWERSLAFEAYARERARGLPELPLFPDQAAQMARAEQDEEAIRRFLETNNILTVPGWVRHYRNRPLPAYVEPLAGLGVADDLTSATRLDENGVSYIRPPSPALPYFALASARDPRPIIVHEGVPGHYLQLALSWAHENPIRRRYYDSGANEGIGFYAEEMMLQAGLFDDSPRTREIMYNFMRLRALRVEVEVKLALGVFTIDQAADYLRTRTPMDLETARFEAVFFASLPGQAITYQIGKLQIVQFLADARQRLGDKFNLRAFHDFVWKNGNVPIALQRWEYLGLSDQIDVLDERREAHWKHRRL